jgi:hypothetical protein
MVDDAPAPAQAEQELRDNANDDDEENESNEESEDERNEEDNKMTDTQDYGILGEVLKSPYYFACAFITIGVFGHAAMPFVNWYTIWFLLTQAIIMGAFGAMCFGLGIFATSQNTVFVGVSNALSILLKCPYRLIIAPRTDVLANNHNQALRDGLRRLP